MARKQPTLEQQETARARREQFRRLAKQVSGLSDDQRQALAMKCWPTTCEGHALSVTNACLIGLQMPTATLVGGFRQWIKQGRCVCKGEHGLSIWIPGGAGPLNSNGGNESGEAPDIRFLMATVFDVSQTQEIQSVASAA